MNGMSTYGIIKGVLLSKKFSVAALTALMALVTGVAKAEMDIAPRAAVSNDGFIRVVAYDNPRDEVGFRLPILAFAGKIVDSISATFEMKRTKVKAPGLIIYAMDGRTNDTRVLVRPETRKDGSHVVKIFLPSPGYSDLDELRNGIARAFIGPVPPDWVVQGALRCVDEDVRRADQRFVLTLWSDGRLPFFPALCSDLRVAKGAAAALPGYVVGWIREKKLFAKLLEGEWDGKRLAELLTGETEPALQDRASDERLARLARSVLEPGDCGIFELDVFSSKMFLYSPFFDMNMIGGRSVCSFREALDANGSNLMVQAAAFLKSREVPLYAIGRGDELQAIAATYERFLLGVAAGEEREKLEEMLNAADARLEKAYEKRRKDNNRQR